MLCWDWPVLTIALRAEVLRSQRQEPLCVLQAEVRRELQAPPTVPWHREPQRGAVGHRGQG